MKYAYKCVYTFNFSGPTSFWFLNLWPSCVRFFYSRISTMLCAKLDFPPLKKANSSIYRVSKKTVQLIWRRVIFELELLKFVYNLIWGRWVRFFNQILRFHMHSGLKMASKIEKKWFRCLIEILAVQIPTLFIVL